MGGDEGPEHMKAHRLVNSWEFAKLARQAADVGRYVIAAGDFNSVPTAVPMTFIRDHALLNDAWVETHKHVRSPSSVGVPSAVDAIHMYGVTADSPLNSYSAGKNLEPYAKKFQGKRLDYVLYGPPAHASAGSRAPLLRCIDTKVMLTEDVPGTNYSYSDHFGLEATFEIILPGADDTLSGEDEQARHITAPAPADPLSPNPSQPSALASVPNPIPPPRRTLSPEYITGVLQSLTSRYRFALAQARYHLTIFAVCIGLLLALIISSAFLPRSWINPIYMVVTIFIAWLATTMLYIGFVYGQWEVNALTNVIEELEIYRNSLEDRQGSPWRSSTR